jgi:hypothetical protein
MVRKLPIVQCGKYFAYPLACLVLQDILVHMLLIIFAKVRRTSPDIKKISTI